MRRDVGDLFVDFNAGSTEIRFEPLQSFFFLLSFGKDPQYLVERYVPLEVAFFQQADESLSFLPAFVGDAHSHAPCHLGRGQSRDQATRRAECGLD